MAMLLAHCPPLLAAGLLTAGALTAQVSLGELPDLARSRAERQRPAQEQAMQPFWGDLILNYRTNREYLDGKIDQVAQLGDSVVPLLLEKLTPADNAPSTRHLAENCARVLRHLDPATFVDALVELAEGTNETARREAIRLIGYSKSESAALALAELLPRLPEDERLLAVAALGRLESHAGAKTIANMLGSTERDVREEALRYLERAKPPSVAPVVVQALQVESDNRLLPRYIAYIGAVVRGDGAVAAVLLPLMDGQRLDWEDKRRLVEALGSIAPEGHEPTMEALQALLDQGETGSLGLQAALTLQRLGDKSGMTKLFKTLNDELRKPSHRRDASLLVQRADLYFAAESWTEALSDYEKAFEFTSNSLLATRCLLMMARCEAHKSRWSRVLRRLQQAQASYETVIRMSQEDPAMQEALQQEKIRSWLNELPKGGG